MPADHPYIQYEYRVTKEQVEAEKLVRGDVGLWGLTKDLLKSPGHRYRTLLGMGLIFFKTFSGVQAVNYYSPIIFEQLGFSGTKNSLFATGVSLGPSSAYTKANEAFVRSTELANLSARSSLASSWSIKWDEGSRSSSDRSSCPSASSTSVDT